MYGIQDKPSQAFGETTPDSKLSKNATILKIFSTSGSPLHLAIDVDNSRLVCKFITVPQCLTVYLRGLNVVDSRFQMQTLISTCTAEAGNQPLEA
jgi:hypothetical protein